jgi:hypothetical protein
MTNCQFLVQTAIQAGGVLATLVLAAIALWGEQLKAKWFGPRLTLRLLDRDGERQMLPTGTYARYYRLRVANSSRMPASNVRVLLTRIARPDANGTFQWQVVSGGIQLEWQHGHALPQQYLVLGPRPQNADLGSVLQQGTFSLTPLFQPPGLRLALGLGGERSMIVESIAASDETESAPLRVSIAWDGQWSDDTAEMRRHLVIEEEPCPRQ